MNRTDAFVADWMLLAPGFSVLVELTADADNAITIEKIQAWPSDKRGKSEATLVMEALCHLADVYGVTLLGWAQPYNKHPESAIRLRLWLGHHGFEPSSGAGLELQLNRLPLELTGHIANA
jgi:hypothetical protein